MEFSDNATAKLLQTVPELAKYILTFEDVTHELPEDSGLTVGVFILRAGQEMFFIPVIAKGDNIYPIDSIFFDAKKKFFPITSQTTAMVESASQVTQGKPSKIPDTVDKNPSIYHMINPPRTGKHVYASTSRLVEFLATLPFHIKEAMADGISEEKSLYDKLDGMFGLRSVMEVLRHSEGINTPSHSEAKITVVTQAQAGQSPEQISALLRDGYYVNGKQPKTRIAVAHQDFNKHGVFTTISNVDGDKDFNVAFSNGSIREAYVPKMYCGHGSSQALAIFTDGSYALSSSLISSGTALARRNVLQTLFNSTPPGMVKDVWRDDTIVLVLNSNEFLGPFKVEAAVSTNLGTVLKVRDQLSYRQLTIHAYRSFSKSILWEESDIYVPSSTAVFKLTEDRTPQLERSVNGAARRSEINDLQFMGDELNLSFDGVEYSMNGAVVGGAPMAIKRLVEGEGIDPVKAASFVKQAQETKRTKIYLTKKAYSTDFEPAKTQTYGQTALPQDKLGLNGSFLPNLKSSLTVNDSQVAEATIISELLQTPDMGEAIQEYLPDIEDAIDKLGRTLFLARVNINKLSETYDVDGIYSFLSSLKNVYKLLGDNYLKLQSLISVGLTSQKKKEK